MGGRTSTVQKRSRGKIMLKRVLKNALEAILGKSAVLISLGGPKAPAPEHPGKKRGGGGWKN